MTAPQAPGTQRNAFEQTMLFYGFLGVAGTGGIETAMAGHQRTDSVVRHYALDDGGPEVRERFFAAVLISLRHMPS